MTRPRTERPHLAPRKSLRQLASEWDAVASLRSEQIDGHKDLSFHYVLVPEIERLARPADWSHVLDAGCGTGFLTERLARRADAVVGVDMSHTSIDIATNRHLSPNIRYVRSSIETFARRPDTPRFSLVVANMTLMTAPNLSSFMRAVGTVLKPGGTFVFTITHPWFWPTYWGYDKARWFDYDQELAVEAPFRISVEKSPFHTTHFHRPLYRYVHAFTRAGLALTQLDEPTPSPRDMSRYPRQWKFPRFMAGTARSMSSGNRPS